MKVIKVKRQSVSAPPPPPTPAPRAGNIRYTRPVSTAAAPSAQRPAAGQARTAPKRKQAAGGPPVALFAVIGLVVVVLIAIGIAISSNSASPPPQRAQATTIQRGGPKEFDRPLGDMRDYMKAREEPELLKQRKARMAGKRP